MGGVIVGHRVPNKRECLTKLSSILACIPAFGDTAVVHGVAGTCDVISKQGDAQVMTFNVHAAVCIPHVWSRLQLEHLLNN